MTKVKKLIYIGKRLFNDTRAAPCFLEGKDRVFYTKAKFCTIGHVYESVNDKLARTPDSKGLAPKITEDQIEKWELEEQADIEKGFERRAKAKAERIFKNKKFWFKSLREIYEDCQRLNLSHFDSDYLAKRIVKAIVWGKE